MATPLPVEKKMPVASEERRAKREGGRAKREGGLERSGGASGNFLLDLVRKRKRFRGKDFPRRLTPGERLHQRQQISEHDGEEAGDDGEILSTKTLSFQHQIQ